METSLVCEKGKVKKDVNVVQLHGSLRKLKCTICSEPYGFLNDFEKVFREGEAPDCPKCELNGKFFCQIFSYVTHHATNLARC